MIKALWTAATGMNAEEMYLNVISNNMANVNTTAYKKVDLEFQDLIYQNVRNAGTPVAAGQLLPTGLQVGSGVKPSATVRTFTVGSFKETGRDLDVAIEGDGFFQVLMPDGTIKYTRDGAFKLDADGNLVTSDGFYLQPPITVPAEATSINIGMDGTVTAIVNGNAEELGQITLVRFANAAGLKGVGKNLFEETAASGPALGPFIPGNDGTGTLLQRFLEMSNVKAVEEMVNMITSQRAYEMNSKAIQTADQMLAIVSNLKR